MRFCEVRLNNFRNLMDGSVGVSSGQVFLVGENGQGKTNFLEALYLLCYGNSFRTRNIRDLVRHGCPDMSVGADFIDIHGDKRSIRLSYADGKKTFCLDGREVRDRKEVIYNIPCIVFSYDDINLVRGEPEFRRIFFDQTLCMMDMLYLDDLRHYKAILKQRNAAVRESMTGMLDTYDILLARYGIRIMQARNEACRIMNLIFPDLYASISGDGRRLEMKYRPSWSEASTEEDAIRILAESRERDLKMQFSTSGVHRDRFVITDQRGLFQNTGSTGQLRLASLVLRTAQAAYFRRQMSQDPVMLIDDVLLELDSGKRGEFLRQLGSYSQAFFTFLSDEKYFTDNLGVRGGSLYYTVRGGELTEDANGF